MNSCAAQNNPISILGRVIRLIEKEDSDLSSEKTSQESSGEKSNIDKLLLKEIELFQSLPSFEEYDLSSKDILIITHLWSNHLSSPFRGICWDDLCKKAGIDLYDTNVCLSYIQDLYRRKVIDIENKQWHPSFNSPFDIIGSEISLKKELLVRIFNYNVRDDIENNLAEKWEHIDIFLRDLFYSMKIIMYHMGCDIAISYWRDPPKFEIDNLISHLQPLIQRLKEAPDTLKIAQLVRRLCLDDREIMILLIVIYCNTMELEQIEAGMFLQIISRNDQEYNHNAQYLEPDSRLISGKLIRICPDIRTRFIRRIAPTPGLLRVLKKSSNMKRSDWKAKTPKSINRYQIINISRFFRWLRKQNT